MSSNVNLVDKLNPIYFEKHKKIEISKEDMELIIKQFENNRISNNAKNQESKVTIFFGKTEEQLIEFENLYQKYINDLDVIVKKVTKKNDINETNETNEIEISSNTNKLNTDNSVKKKPFLKFLLNLLINPLLNPF